MNTNVYELLYIFQSKMYILMYECLLKGETKLQILAKVKVLLSESIKNIDFNPQERVFLWSIVEKTYSRVVLMINASLKRYKTRQEAIYRSVYYHYSAKNGTRKELFELFNEYNGRIRQDIVKNLIKNAKDSKNPFFLCSSHTKCRTEHGFLQGKVYYDAGWKEYIRDIDDARYVQNYIKTRNLMSIQEVTGRPYYLLTSPNCRHMMINISIEDTKNFSIRSMLRKNKLIDNYKKQKPTNFKAIDRYFYRSLRKSA